MNRLMKVANSALTSLVAQESARPYFQYSAYYSAGSPYTNMFATPQPEDALMASPPACA